MKQMPRKICVVTGSRAEYGLLYWLLKEINADPNLELQLIVTGMHLAPGFGLTIRHIEEDGFVPDARVDMLVASDTPVGIAKSIGLGVIGFSDALARLAPDLMVILGDRFEVLAAAQAAMVARIPIAHIHGGELTEGLIDEAIRHSLTKMSQLHFVSAEPYRRRVIQLGESPDRVWNVGALGLDNIRLLPRLDRKALSDSINFELQTPYFLVTYHPVTLCEFGCKKLDALFGALAEFPDYQILITGVNADAGNQLVRDSIWRFAASNPDRTCVVESLGQMLYLSALAHAEIVIGNSSSALIEAPSFNIPTVNVGDRQRGRIRATSVIDSTDDQTAITQAIRRALEPAFRDRLKEAISPFGDGYAAEKIRKVLASYPLDNLLVKCFHDINP